MLTVAAGRTPMRLWVCAAAGAVSAVLAGVVVGVAYAFSVGWDVAAAVFLVWTWLVIGRMDATATAAHATREDPSKRVTRIVVLAACVGSLAGVGYLLLGAGSDRGAAQWLVDALGVGSVVVSWLVLHTLFTLHYALLYYGTGPGSLTPDVGGVDFQLQEPPRYTDFAYVAFTIGMTYQVSDTQLTARPVRMTALRHALLSYLFGSLILAAMVNLIASLASQG